MMQIITEIECSICRGAIQEIVRGEWEHLATSHSQWGPICVMNPQPLELPTSDACLGPSQ